MANQFTQKFNNIYSYINEYQRMVYEIYAADVVSFLCTYYHIDGPETIWEDEDMFAGSYDRVGEYSGVKWNKILLLPIYYSEEITTSFDGQEIGLVKEGETSFVFPSIYGITPLPNDKIKFEQNFLRPTNDVYPIYNVTGREKSVNTDYTYWKLRVKVEQSITETQLEEQVQDTYAFYDYDKRIHTVSNSTFLTRLLMKNDIIRERLKNIFHDRNSGYYLV
jgi:hypothetical protein